MGATAFHFITQAGQGKLSRQCRGIESRPKILRMLSGRNALGTTDILSFFCLFYVLQTFQPREYFSGS
jgi:hypothetical protein